MFCVVRENIAGPISGTVGEEVYENLKILITNFIVRWEVVHRLAHIAGTGGLIRDWC
jgi:hypothetical protein